MLRNDTVGARERNLEGMRHANLIALGSHKAELSRDATRRTSSCSHVNTRSINVRTMRKSPVFWAQVHLLNA
jgi:hypothetical protein